MNFHNNQTQYVSMAEGFMAKVYAWMFAGLGVTAGISYYIGTNHAMMQMAAHTGIGMTIGLILAQLGIIYFLASQIQTMNTVVSALLFFAFSSIMGFTLAPIQLVYTTASIVNMMVTTAGMFLVMAIYGWTTKSDLSSMRNILLMGLLGLIVAGLVNMFLQSSALAMITSAIGVGIFTMLIAYDVQRLKSLSQQMMMTPQFADNLAINGALGLYLNVINLFLQLLQLFGDRRD